MLERDLPAVEPRLQQKFDAIGRSGAPPWQNILAYLRRLADDSYFASVDDQARMSTESLRKCFYAFCLAVNKCYGDKYLNRLPEDSELALIEQKFSDSLFRGRIGSLDSMHV